LAFVVVTEPAHAIFIRMLTSTRESSTGHVLIAQAIQVGRRGVGDDNGDVLFKMSISERCRAEKRDALGIVTESVITLDGATELSSLDSGTSFADVNLSGNNSDPDDSILSVRDWRAVVFTTDGPAALQFTFDPSIADVPVPTMLLSLESVEGPDVFHTLEQREFHFGQGTQTHIQMIPAEGTYRFVSDWAVSDFVLPPGDSSFGLSYSLDWSPVPEPQSAALLGLGLAFLGTRRRPRADW
jgi:hypothetical protein